MWASRILLHQFPTSSSIMVNINDKNSEPSGSYSLFQWNLYKTQQTQKTKWTIRWICNGKMPTSTFFANFGGWLPICSAAYWILSSFPRFHCFYCESFCSQSTRQKLDTKKLNILLILCFLARPKMVRKCCYGMEDPAAGSATKKWCKFASSANNKTCWWHIRFA